MMNSSPLPFLALAAALAGVPAFAQDRPEAKKAGPSRPVTKVHRLDAGQPDANGWYPAKSTGAGFTVLVPNKFNDVTVTARAKDGVEVRADEIGTTTPAGAKFLVVRMKRGDNRLEKDVGPGLGDSFVKQGTLKARRPLTYRGAKVIELEVEGKTSASTMRFLQKGAVVYQLVAEYPTSSQEAMAKDLPRFFDSFRFPEGEGD